MENNTSDFEKYQKAKQQVKEQKEFYIHSFWFVAVMIFLAYINIKHTPEYLWFFWPFLGWGIGLFFHGASVFNFLPFFTKDWEEKRIKQFIEEEKRNENNYQ